MSVTVAGIEAGLRDDPGLKVLTTFGDFMADLTPPDEVIDGLLPMSRAFSLTGAPGAGKTTVGTLLALCVASGTAFAAREVKQGRVLYLCGESAHDLRLHLAASATALNLSAGTWRNNIIIRDGTLHLGAERVSIHEDVERAGPLALAIVDTSAAYFPTDSEIDSMQARDHARNIRALTTLPGNPAVIALSHPAKSVSGPESLVPRGAGAFLAELDGNYTLWAEGDGRVQLHHSGKFRAAPFDPITFELRPMKLEGVTDRKGKPVFSVIAHHVDESDGEALSKTARAELGRVLYQLLHHPKNCSLAQIAHAVGLSSKTKAQRHIDALTAKKLVQKDPLTGQAELTPAGRKYAERIA